MLTLQFVPYSELQGLQTRDKIDRILKLVKEDKIVLIEGRLNPSEEADLIERTMQELGDSFKGIELCTVYPDADMNFTNKLKNVFVNMLVGQRQGLTVVGPATIVKEIRRDPNKIQLLTENISEKKISRKKVKRKASKRRR